MVDEFPMLSIWASRVTNLGARVLWTFETVADRRWLAAGVAGLVVLFYCIVVAGIRMPVPRVAGEFSYLLAADTYAAGRLTNPPHRLGDHFNSTDILREPTYQSKYPPGQGLFLALGQKVGGHPLLGVWLSLMLACAALVWMLQAWVGNRWALFGGLLAASNGPMVFAWGGNFMGGAVAMVGGALLFGALRRIIDEPRPANAVPLALGVAILANTRPYEGLVASLIVAVFLVAWFIRETRVPKRLLAVRVLMPVAAVLVLTAVWMGYYNWAVTGTPWRLPYQVHMENYGGEANFGSLSGGAAGLRPQLATLVTSFIEKMASLFLFWGGKLGVPIVVGRLTTTVDVLSILILGMLPWIARKRWTLFALLTFGLTLGAASLTVLASHFYIAPVVPLYFLLAVESIRTVWRSLSRRRVGQVPVATAFLAVWVLTQMDEVLVYMNRQEAIDPSHWTNVRQLLIQPLERDEFSHLVVVRREPGVGRPEVWVYNRANIDSAKIVWAWEVEGIPTRRLLSYYAGRHAWLADVTATPLALVELQGPQLDWALLEQRGAAGRMTFDDSADAVRVDIEAAGNEPWHLVLENFQPSVAARVWHSVSFRARADSDRTLTVHVGQAHPPWMDLGFRREVELTPQWQQFDFVFNATRDDNWITLQLDVGQSRVAVEVMDQPLVHVTPQATPGGDGEWLLREWLLRQQGGAIARLEDAEDDPGAVRVSVEQSGTEPWHLQLESFQPPVRGGVRYTVSFRARADAPRAVGVHVSKAHEPWSGLGLYRTLELTTEWQQFAFEFSATQDDMLVRLAFDLGGSNAGVDIADQALTPAFQR